MTRLSAQAPPGLSSWKQLDFGRFAVFSNAPAKDMQRAALLLHLSSSALDRLLGPLPPASPPVNALFFRSASEFEPFRVSAASRGFYQSSPEVDYLVLPLSSPSGDRVLRHELTHLYLNHTSPPLPQWLEEGLAEFFSTLDAAKGQVTIGRVIDSHVDVLATTAWFPPPSLLRINKASPEFNQPHSAGLFYAQSWALVHLLQHHPSYRGKLPQLSAALSTAANPEGAFRQVYGVSLPQLEADLRAYLATRRFPVHRMALPASSPAPSSPRSLPEPEAAALLAGLYSATGNIDAARTMYARLARVTPDTSRDHVAAQGFLALQQGDFPLAIARFRASVGAGSRNASVHFELAMLLRDAHRPDSEVEPLLESSVALNPAFAEAWYQLGQLRLRQGRLTPAIEAFRRAVAILPRQAPFREALDHALGQAAAPAPSPPAPPSGPSVRVPPSWQPPAADSTARGTLTRVDCDGPALVFHLQTASGPLRLTASQPASVRIDGSTAPREFPCGEVHSRPVIVRYSSASRELVALDYQ